MISDFRINQKNAIQVWVNSKWYNLIIFTDDCPYGKYGYKLRNVKKPFNPYEFFSGEDVEKIESYLNR